MSGLPLRHGALIGDRYELDRVVGTGGMGVVWAARDIRSGRSVAIKFIQDELGTEADRLRWLSEARTSSELRHPHIVEFIEVLDCGDEPPALVMEPDNIFIARSGAGETVIKVLDFGIAKRVPLDEETARSLGSTTTDLIGTFTHMSPEQVTQPGISMSWRVPGSYALRPMVRVRGGNAGAVTALRAVPNQDGSTTAPIALQVTPLIVIRQSSGYAVENGAGTFDALLGGLAVTRFQWRTGGAIQITATTKILSIASLPAAGQTFTIDLTLTLNDGTEAYGRSLTVHTITAAQAAFMERVQELLHIRSSLPVPGPVPGPSTMIQVLRSTPSEFGISSLVQGVDHLGRAPIR